MLKSLSIRNYALIEELDVEFDSGLNIITGETGAGKSIIIDALSLTLGERADTSVVRKGAEKATVEGVFEIGQNKKVKKLLEQHEIEVNDELILRREISIRGQSRCFINDSPATITLLKQVGDMLVDLHGQHEHQSLLRTETHIEMLDDFGGLKGLVNEFLSPYRKALELTAAISDLQSKERQLKEKRELYEFQLKEIDSINPQSGEEEQLETDLRILENAEHLYTVTERLYQILYEGENAVHDQLVLIRNQLEDLEKIDTSFEETKNEALAAIAIVSELVKFIQRYNARIEFNPERLEEIRLRLGQLTLLKKKYGGSLEAVIAHREKIFREIQLAENFDAEIQSLQNQLEEVRRECSDIAFRLSAKRQEAGKKIDRAVERELKSLGIANPTFETRIQYRKANHTSLPIVNSGNEWYETTPLGIDFIEFYVSTNLGEEVKPLAKVASGGEVSRIMLALKSILAKTDRLPLLVFDEIDVGVSGRIAQVVGQSLKNLSRFHQVIAITHLPQIAGFADSHFVVEKIEDKQRAITRMRKLEIEERVEEVAKLISGAEITESGLESARELLGINK